MKVRKAVILAAGRGKRLEPLTLTTPKVMLPLAGKPLLEYILEAAKEAGIGEAVLVVGHGRERIEEYFGDGSAWNMRLEYALQGELMGTAHALGQVRLEEDFLALNGDTLISQDCIKEVLAHHSTACTMGLRKVEDPGSYGAVRLDGERVVEVVEKPREFVSDLVNAGIYAFSPKVFDAIAETPVSERKEYELTTAIQLLIKGGEEVRGIEVKGLWRDIGNPWSYLDTNGEMLRGMEARIEGEMEEFVKVKGKLHLGKGAVVRSGTYIEGPVYVGEGSTVGPNAYLRGNVAIGKGCRIGNSVEVKNSVVMDGTHIPHLSYVGDSIIGRDCNLGAGTLVGNLRLDGKTVKMHIGERQVDTGRRKMGCVMGDNVKTGLNSMINAGRKIGPGAVIGPGVIVYRDIPPGAFVIQRQELEERKEGRGEE